MSETRSEDTMGQTAPKSHPTSVDDLPPPDTTRWVVRRKAQVVAGVRAGILSVEDACKRYNLSLEEFMSWQSLVDRHGPRGLRATRVQQYRPSQMRRKP